MSKRNVMLALVGKQPLAIVLPVFHEPPDELVLLCTPDTAEQARWIMNSLAIHKTTSSVVVTEYPQRMSAYDADLDLAICRQAIENYAGTELVFNITGGTKLMSTSATMAARQAGIDTIYVVTDDDGRLIRWTADSAATEKLRVHIPIASRFACHGYTIQSALPWNSHYLECSKILANLAATCQWQKLIGNLAAMQDNMVNPDPVNRPYSLERNAAFRLADMGFWHASITNGKLRISLYDDPDRSEFLKGKWLEAFVYQACSHCSGGNTLFDECIPNVTVRDDSGSVSNEFDLVVCRNEEMAICSCKAGGYIAANDAKSAIYELESVAGAIRVGAYCRKVLISARYILPKAAMDRAKRYGMTIVTGGELPRVGKIISKALNK